MQLQRNLVMVSVTPLIGGMREHSYKEIPIKTIEVVYLKVSNNNPRCLVVVLHVPRCLLINVD